MAKKLQVDFDQLSSTIANYNRSIEGFENMKRNLRNTTGQLKDSGWKSAASTAFFQSIDETWEKNMQSHIEVLKHLKECLDLAKSDYTGLANSIPDIGKVL